MLSTCEQAMGYSLYLAGRLTFLPLRVNTAGESGAAGGGEGAAEVLAVGGAALLTGALTGSLTGIGVLSATGDSAFSGTGSCICRCGRLLMLTLFLLSIFPVGVSTMYDLGSGHFSLITASLHLLDGWS